MGEFVECPVCCGVGTVKVSTVIAIQADVECGVCHGAGWLDEPARDWYERGRKAAIVRVQQRGETQLECARRLGTTPRHVNDMEHLKAYYENVGGTVA